MTLYDLMEDITIQGDVRLALFDEGGDEIAVAEFKGLDGFCFHDLLQHEEVTTIHGDRVEVDEWGNLEVTYIFCPGDGFLHIEVQQEEE